MRPIILLLAALGAAAPLAPASADGFVEDGYRSGARRPALHGRGGYAPQRWAERRVRRGGYARSYRGELAPAYGAHPPFFPGAGHAAPDGPAVLAEYREPYIGRGLIYNVPPDPFFASATVVRALN